ncbi:Putative neurobeachin homolog [Trichuris trichiura]|uniref:Putative neurobeachin homolog n=1 Tax=Trichuris trichiura TaxID=36087 RepID=A0A077ZHP2_TRITR|nr:Putative neurobeachin homolog [Trichuris trichiura]
MENAFILREGHHVRLMINLLDKCPSHLQAEILSVFIGIARRSNRNLEKCLENDLIRILLERLADANCMLHLLADLLIELLTVLTTYSVNVKDMNAVLRYLRASNKRWPCHSVKLLVVVKQMMRKDGPDIFFTLSGHPNSGIHIPPLSRWPYQNGWSFVTWLRLDPETSGNFEEDMPYLFSFRTRSGFGHSCHFVGGCMVLTANKSKGGQALQQCIKYEFQLRKWYHVALAYSFSRWGRSEVHCYINGQRTSVVDLNWHVNTNEQYDRCFVGCSPDTNVKNSFSGQLSALYLFSETLSLQQVNSLYYLGPNYQSCFKFKNEVDIPSAYLKYLFDGKLAGSLVFAYCPKNCDRQLCLNSVNKENQVHFRQTTHAVMMDGVRVVVTHSIYTSLHSVGGVQILLPLLSQLDLRSFNFSSILLSIFSQLLQSSPDVQLQMMQSNAFLVIGVALTAADKAHMTESVLNTLIDTAQFLMVPSATNLGLLRQLFDYVLLNPDLWINTDGKVGVTRLYGYLATDFFNGAKIFNSMRRVTTVMQLLHALKFYYWVTDPLSVSCFLDGPRPSVEQITAIRTYILTLLFKIIVKDEPNAQSADEVEAILNFLTTVHEDDNLIDVLQTLIRLMAENPATLVPTFDKKKGLIGADGEMVRLLALKLLGFFLCRCTAKRKQDAMTPHNLYTLLVDSSSKENRRSILQMSVWQDWLISLTSLRPKSPAEQSILKLVYQLFSTLLHHAIRLEFGGWRVWIDTMAIIHSKVNFLSRFGANPPAGLAVPLYRIPEFRWSSAHLTLLSDLLLSIESDIAAWKNDGSRTLIDFINQSENAVFVVNSVHVISQSLDNFIVACGGLLPLLAALTSPNTDLDIVDTTSQGLPVKVAISFLIRLANLADVIVFGTACNFADLEHEKNMPNGGIMRQILRLAVRVSLPFSDHSGLDVYRLKAAVYRDIEESRQCQFLALATVYFISVLMVSRYRDILEPPSSPSPFHNTGMAGSNWDQVDKREHKNYYITHGWTCASYISSGSDKSESIAAESAVQKGDKPDERLAENHDAQDKLVERKNSFNRERQALLTARLRNALDPVAPLFREIISDFQSYFQKTLLGTHGQEIMNDHKVLNTLRNPSVSVVELVMLLCSQEWQTSLQKHAGLAFIELVNEGRLLAHATRDHLVRVANEAEYILNRIRAEDVVKHAEFEALCAQAVVTCKEEENTCNLLLSAARRRNVIISRRILQKIVNILNSDYGYWTLDLWEDDSRRRKRLIPNPYGSSHPEATLKAIEVEEARDALAAYLSGKNIALPSLTPSSASDELVTESEVNLWNDEKETEQNQHASCLITPCHLIAPGLALPGILSVTANEVAFDAKEDEPEFKRADPQVVRYCEHLHGRWHTGEIRAIFLRCYLLQYRALELFMASRTAVMFAFGDQSAVKQVVKQLPPVGVGVKYGIAQNRKASLMTPRQLFKLSDMPQKWQKREISNFDYLMFLNTIAGRTYNDLNQYPVFPWILSNYESKELDLKQPANFRDLSKRFLSLLVKSRRSTTAPITQLPCLLICFCLQEPFTTLFLNLQGGKFDHADRMFHSIGESWTRCLRDTHDVKELIPEFFYLPEILLNINGYNLGKRDDGTIMGDVKLPPWAKSAEHFISIHRQQRFREKLPIHELFNYSSSGHRVFTGEAFALLVILIFQVNRQVNIWSFFQERKRDRLAYILDRQINCVV